MGAGLPRSRKQYSKTSKMQAHSTDIKHGKNSTLIHAKRNLSQRRGYYLLARSPPEGLFWCCGEVLLLASLLLLLPPPPPPPPVGEFGPLAAGEAE